MLQGGKPAMLKSQLLLVDTNIIIYTHEIDIWPLLIKKCPIALTSAVQDESRFWVDHKGNHYSIDLNEDINNKKVVFLDVPLSSINILCKMFGPTYLDRMDIGETDSLAFLYENKDKDVHICSSDSIVFKVLGSLGLREKGISLEELLNDIGLGRSLEWRFQKSFREKYTLMGEQEGITGMAAP
jgi:hypothetical protein